MQPRAHAGDAFVNVVYASGGMQAVLLITAVLVAVSIVLPILFKR
jgi:hypothetical protein